MTTRNSRGAAGDAAKDVEAGGEQPFEKALTRLEKIVAEMEQGKLPLEEMIARFEEGQGLIKLCNRKLNEVERRIEVLVRKGDAVEAQPFEAPADASEAEPRRARGGGELF